MGKVTILFANWHPCVRLCCVGGLFYDVILRIDCAEE